MMFSDADIERARSVPIQSLVAHLRLRKVGRELCGPCPRCAGVDRFAISLTKQVFHCRGCLATGGVIDLAMFLHDVGFAEAIAILCGTPSISRCRPPATSPNSQVKLTEADDDYERQQHAKAAALWTAGVRVVDTAAADYLWMRAITCRLPKTLRFLPARNGHHPALMCAFSFVPESEPGVLAEPAGVDAIHLVLLRADGSGKADVTPSKKTIGRPLGRPIMVAAPRDGYAALTICEGVEDALSAHQATGQAAWASGGATFMPALADSVPKYFETVTVAAHPDQAGQRDARTLADRLIERGFEVFTDGLNDG